MIYSMNAEDYEDVLDDDNPVLILFWADWNQASREMVAVLEALEPEFERKINFYKMNMDSNKGLCDKIGVRGVPYIIFFYDRMIVKSITGTVSVQELRKQIDLFLASLM